jgi:hypothetical protein
MYFHRAIAALDHENISGMFYLHPWEVDPEQPRLEVGLKSRFRQYTGLHRMQQNLENLFFRHQFGPVREVYGAQLKSALGAAAEA